MSGTLVIKKTRNKADWHFKYPHRELIARNINNIDWLRGFCDGLTICNEKDKTAAEIASLIAYLEEGGEITAETEY